MSQIVWVLVITVYGFYGIPKSVEVPFKSEAECEAVLAAVTTSNGKSVDVRCEPRKAK